MIDIYLIVKKEHNKRVIGTARLHHSLLNAVYVIRSSSICTNNICATNLWIQISIFT